MTTTKQLNENVFSYILNAIDGSGYDKQLTTDKEKLQFLSDNFNSEYGWQVQRIGYFKAFNEWLQGLPSSFNIDFQYCDIIRIAKEWDSLPQTPTDKQIDKILNNWFSFITNKTIQLMKRNKVLPLNS